MRENAERRTRHESRRAARRVDGAFAMGRRGRRKGGERGGVGVEGEERQAGQTERQAKERAHG